jgi:stage IV sporulation protein FB
MLVFMIVTDTSGMIMFGIASAFLHEIGHLLTAYFCNEKIRKINFGFANVDIVAGSEWHKPNAAILISGSMVNFAVALIFNVLYLYLGNRVLGIIACQNLCIGIFNLLPISTLDGGQLLSLFLNKKFDVLLSEKILNIVSVIILIPVCFLGFLILINSRYNFSLLILSCYLISYIFFKEDI